MTKNNIENVLLNLETNDSSIDQQIYQESLSRSHNRTFSEITSFNDLLPEFTFHILTIYSLYNRNTGQKTFINGIQAESLLGLDLNTREKLLSRASSAFLTDDYYVKFLKAKVLSSNAYKPEDL